MSKAESELKARFLTAEEGLIKNQRTNETLNISLKSLKEKKVKQRRASLEKAVEIKVPREFIEILGLKDTKGLERHSRIILAVELYVEGRASLGRAAELAGVSYDEFWDFLKDRGHKIRAGPKSLEEAEREYKVAKERLRK